jgi:hypothetical protein
VRLSRREYGFAAGVWEALLNEIKSEWEAEASHAVVIEEFHFDRAARGEGVMRTLLSRAGLLNIHRWGRSHCLERPARVQSG